MKSLDFQFESKPATVAIADARSTVLPPAVSRWRQLLTSSSIFLWLAVLLCYLFQPDILAAGVLVPPWCWVVAGCMLAMLGLSRIGWRWSLAALALWAVFAFTFMDECRAVVRSVGRAISGDPPASLSFDEWKSVRVVTLNCAGNPRAAQEAIAQRPDIVLLQEAPSRDGVRSLTQTLFGDSGTFIHEGDTAIVAGGAIERRTPAGEQQYAHGRVQLAGGPTVDVVSLRLTPPVFRMDLWQADFWREHRDRRAEHRSEIGRLLKHLRQTVPVGPIVAGGDFNTTPNDLILLRLKSRLFDTFNAAGQGWGNTGTNEYPLFRVDQIWASRDFSAVDSKAVKTAHSDHRLVVSELNLRDRSERDSAVPNSGER